MCRVTGLIRSLGGLAIKRAVGSLKKYASYDFLLVFVTFLLHAVILTNLDECETLRPMINPCVYSDDIPEVTRSYLNEENVLQTALKCTLSLPLGSAEVTN